MSSGSRQLVFNTRERPLSTDFNRMQLFADRALAEVLRRLVNMGGDPTDVLELGSYVDTLAKDTVPIATPLKADVFDGLTVLPQAGSLNLLISPGAVGLDDPDGQAGSSDPTSPSLDDSRYKIVIDAGVTAIGAMTIAPGSGGATRIDVIECQRVPRAVLESDNRDIYDNSTGLFAPVTVPKVVEGQLVYRIRSGTPGAGMPALAQG